MREIKKAIKKHNKTYQVSKIKEDREKASQELGWAFRPLALCPFPAKSLGKRIILNPDGTKSKEHHVIWRRNSGGFKVEILAHPDLGVPFGQDILIILYLAIEARLQKSRRIRVDFYRDFCKMFNMNPNSGFKYRLLVESLSRIRHTKYSWTDERDPNRMRGIDYIYIEDMDLYCNPKNPDQKPMFDQYILLSERFWDEINRHKIPLNLEAIRFLKTKSAHLNFYIWLSYRVAMNYLKNKRIQGDYQKRLAEPNQKNLMIGGRLPETEKEVIPFWGDYGLLNQVCTQIKKKFEFRREVKKYMDTVEEIWPKCPVEIDGDALVVCATSPDQLDVQLDPVIEAGKEIRSKKLTKTKEKERYHGFSEKQYNLLIKKGSPEIIEKLKNKELTYKEGSAEISRIIGK